MTATPYPQGTPPATPGPAPERPDVLDADQLTAGALDLDNLKADATGVGFYGTVGTAQPAVTGAKGGNSALASMVAALVALGLITDSTS